MSFLFNCLSTILKTGPGLSKHYTQLAQPYPKVTLQIICKMEHFCQNYTRLHKNNILLPYKTHISYDFSLFEPVTLLLPT